MRTAEQINQTRALIDAELDARIGRRKLSPGLRLAVFRAADARARQGLQPVMTDDYYKIIDRFARPA